jgi:hypothetical protein
MPVSVQNLSFEREVFDLDITSPTVVIQLMRAANLHGLDGVIWDSFLYSEKLPDDLKRQALLNQTKLSRESLACLLFDVFMQILKKLKFKYSYTQNMSVFSTDFAVEGTEISCLGCTRSFAGLLYNFGFKPQTLKFQKSNPADNDNIKIVMKPTILNTVQGYDGQSLSTKYDVNQCPPTGQELSNGFKLQQSANGSFALEMAPRDPFLNHFCVFVDDGFQYPYFDPLTGGRYQNGQTDLFAAYQRWNVGDLMYGSQSVMVFQHTDDPKSRLYSIPDPANADFDRNPQFTAAKIKYKSENLKLWMLIDPEDWLQSTVPLAGRHRANAMVGGAPSLVMPRQRANAMTGQMLAQHPPKILNLFHLG